MRVVARGFTLLEVMVATAILGLTLTVILSAQGGLAASNKSANQMGTAISLGRCKMTEVEEKLLKFGYADIDDIQISVPCCNDEDTPGFRCDYRAEKVLLPNPPSSQVGGDGGMSLTSPLGSAGSIASALPAGGAAPGGPLANVMSGLNPVAGGGLDLDGGGIASLNFEGGIQNLGTALTQQMGGGGMGTQGLLSMVMGFVYPFMKPMMEASIRRLTVVVHYKEGPKDKDFTLVQYVTNPQNGGFLNGVDGGAPAPGASGTPAAASTGVTPPSAIVTPGAPVTPRGF